MKPCHHLTCFVIVQWRWESMATVGPSNTDSRRVHVVSSWVTKVSAPRNTSKCSWNYGLSWFLNCPFLGRVFAHSQMSSSLSFLETWVSVCHSPTWILVVMPSFLNELFSQCVFISHTHSSLENIGGVYSENTRNRVTLEHADSEKTPVVLVAVVV